MGDSETRKSSSEDDSSISSASSDQPGSESSSDSDRENEDENFYFESDHVALRGSKDYFAMLRTLVLLESQRHQALQDIETIISFQKDANNDPIRFLEGIMNGTVKFPSRQSIATIPHIDWSQFYVTPPEVNQLSHSSKSNVVKSQIQDKNVDKSKFIVRGRVFDNSKPETFNQLWTVEEQRRLEELLVEYPPEEVESNRWRKIAAALGNRTTRQVCSRVQKYFQKLYKAGLPIPGRPPKAHVYSDHRKSNYHHLHQHRKLNKYLARQTTFFPSYDIPVRMTEDDCENFSLAGPVSVSSGTDIHMKETLTSEKLKVECSASSGNSGNSENYNSYKLELLQKVLEHKEMGDQNNSKHVGFQCHSCQENPIIGIRWHCEDCLSPPFNLCTDCVVDQLDISWTHPFSHSIIPISTLDYHKSNKYDKDYVPSFVLPDNYPYNYLDPNFMPL